MENKSGSKDFNSNVTSQESLFVFKSEKWREESPDIPFLTTLEEPLLPNSSLIITGRVKDHAHKFTVNFHLDAKDESDLAFHFNPRLGRYVALNSRSQGVWEEEEVGGGRVAPVPFSRGREFRIDFFFTHFEFLVAVDRYHFCRFGYRASLGKVNRLAVLGDVALHSVTLLGSTDAYPPAAVPNADVSINDRLRVPYWRYFVDPVGPSTRISIRGRIPEKGKSFVLELVSGWSEGGGAEEVGFQLRARLADGYIGCNHKRGGEWGTEEPNACGRSPFAPGHSFALDLLVSDTHYLVCVNGSFLFRFKHRVPPWKIKYMTLKEDVILRRVDFSRQEPGGSFAPTASVTFQYLDIPFRRDFADPIVPKTDLIICGCVKKDAIRFTLNLLDGQGDISFHFDARFDQNYVARNSRVDGLWGAEEASAASRNPFARGREFALEIFATRTEFLVSVSGLHFCSFPHRLPLGDVKTLDITGDVQLTRVELTTKDFYPSVPLAPLKLSAIQGEVATPIVFPLKEPVQLGTEVILRGRVKLLPWSFFINLQDSAHYWPHPQIGFHMSVRLAGRPSVVFNSWLDSGWGREVVEQGLAEEFVPGGRFTVSVLRTEKGFEVAAEGSERGKRESASSSSSLVRSLPPDLRLDTLVLQGDLLLAGLEFTAHPGGK